MKKHSAFTILLACLLALGLSLAACGNGTTGDLEPPPSAVYMNTAKDGALYQLTVTQKAARAASFTPVAGDAYVLDIIKDEEVTNTSTGMVEGFTNNTFTLKPSKNGASTFTVKVSNEQITNISGAVAVQGSDTPVTPASFDTTSGGNSQGGDSQGGNNQGGDSQGGNSQGGNSQGGNSQGGNSQGGNSQGGNSQGNNKTYTVTFNANGGTGTVPAAISVNAGSSAALPSGDSLSKTGYTFGGWNTKADGTGTNTAAGASLTVTASVTLYAKWDAAVSAAYTITFNANGGTGTVPAAITVNAGSSAALPSGDSLAKSGYDFGGWNTKADGTGTNSAAGASLTVTASVTLYAKWDAAVSAAYTITFNANGGTGTVPAAITVNAGSSAALPSGDSLAKSGYDFGGWNTKADGTGTNSAAGASLTVTASITLYAKWNNHVHNYGGWVETTAPTCTTAGVETRTCALDSSHTETRAVAALGHNWGPWTGSTATITTDGVETRTCTRDSTHTETRTAYATGTPGLLFYLINGGTSYNVQAGTVTSGNVVIPAFYNRLPVTYLLSFQAKDITGVSIPSSILTIHERAFADCKSLASVSIPGSVTSIGTNAFASCTSLTSVTLSDGLKTIDYGAFAQCNNLTSINIPGSVTFIGEGAFINCSGLTSFTIPSGLTSISKNTFFRCTSLTSIIIPSSVTSIGQEAFSQCTGITSITIPSSVTSISEWAFNRWNSNQTINVQGHANQASADAAWGSGWLRDCSAVINYQG